MSLLTNNNYTRQKIKIETDRLELKAFFSFLLLQLHPLDQSEVRADEYTKKYILDVLNKIHKKLSDPNIKKIKHISFNYYESIALQEINDKLQEDSAEFDVIYWKVDSKLRKPILQ